MSAYPNPLNPLSKSVVSILHGFRKATNRTPNREIETAIRRMQELWEG
jgi:phage-related protein